MGHAHERLPRAGAAADSIQGRPRRFAPRRPGRWRRAAPPAAAGREGAGCARPRRRAGGPRRARPTLADSALDSSPVRWSARWALNAAVRTVQAAFPALADPDDEWALALLEPEERRLYAAMPAFERAHAVKVARCVAARHPGASREALRAALLHD